MKVRSIRRIVHDSNHNMCTGAAFFKNALFVAFRQGDGHVSPNGKVLVIRSRDEGKTFEHVNLLRGKTDTRDPHLYKVGEERLYAVAFETDPVRIAGASWTDDGIHWSPFQRYTGADGWWMWHPEYHDGRHFCCAYTWKPGNAAQKPWSAIGWFESANGFDWKHIATLDEGDTQPSEANLAFRDNGEAVLLVRRDFADQTPVLMTSQPPYRKWTRKVIDLNIVGLAMWLVDDHVWFAGRWFLHDDVAQMGVFRMEKGKPVLKIVLPAGPGFDFSYMGVAKHPLNSARYWLSYYSNHTAPDDPNVDQWSHPAIYLVDALFDRPFVERFKVSDVVKLAGGLDDAKYPDPAKPGLMWHDVRAYKTGDRGQGGFVDATKHIGGKTGVAYFVTDLDLGPTSRGVLHFGYDGPVRVWVNGKQVFRGPGTNPAHIDQTSVAVNFQHGVNRVAFALDTNGGKACGLFLRYETRK